MGARRDQAECRAAATVHVRLGVHLGAGREQQLGHAYDVVWRVLAVILHAVRRDIVQQRGAMLALRAGANQLRPLA